MAFDPYTQWLDLPPGDRPPSLYAMLGLPPFESDRDAIAAAADRRVAQVRDRAPFDRLTEMRALITEILSGRNRLLDPARKDVYDYYLRRQSAPAAPPTDPAPPPLPTTPAAAVRPGEVPPPVPAVPPSAEATPRGNRTVLWAAMGAGLLGVAAGALWSTWLRDSGGSTPTPIAAASAQGAAGLIPDEEIGSGVDAEPARGAGQRPAEPAAPRHVAPLEVVQAAENPPAPPLPVEQPVEPAAEEIVAAAPTDGEPVEAPTVDVAEVVAALPPPTVRPFPPFARAADEAAFAAHLRDMLFDGFHLGRSGFASAQRHYEAARQLSAADPRLDHGFALVLWKNLKYDEALDRLVAASEASNPPYWPAWQTRIRVRLSRKQLDDALKEAVAFAEQLDRHAGTESDPEDLAAAGWIGRLIGYLEEPQNEVLRRPDDVAQCDQQIRDLLSGPLADAYDHGRSTLAVEFAAMQATSQQSLDELQAQLEEEQTRVLEEIAEQREESLDRGTELSMSAEKWREWIETETRRCDEQLTALTRTYQELSAQAQVLSASITQLNFEIAQTELGELPVGVIASDRTAQEYFASRVLARDQLLGQYRVLEQRASAVTNQGLAVAAARQAAVARYQQATGKLIEEGDAIRKWNKALADRERETKTKTAAGTPQARSLLREARALDTYLPFDLESERQRILDSLPTHLAPDERTSLSPR